MWHKVWISLEPPTITNQLVLTAQGKISHSHLWEFEWEQAGSHSNSHKWECGAISSNGILHFPIFKFPICIPCFGDGILHFPIFKFPTCIPCFGDGILHFPIFKIPSCVLNSHWLGRMGLGHFHSHSWDFEWEHCGNSLNNSTGTSPNPSALECELCDSMGWNCDLPVFRWWEKNTPTVGIA